MRSLIHMLLIMAMMGCSVQSACGQSSDALEVALQKLRAADEDNYKQVLVDIFQQQQQMDFDTAKVHLEKMLESAQKFSYKNAIPDILRILGSLHKTHQLYADSYAYYEEALKVAETYNLPYEQAEAKDALGALMLEQFKFDEGIVYYLEAADLFLQQGYANEAQGVYVILGNAYYHGRDFHNAIRYYKTSLNVNQNPAGLQRRMWAANGLGLAYSHVNRLDSSLNYYAKALEIAHILPDSFYIGLVSGNAGTVYMKRGEYAKAIENLHTDVQLSKQYKEWRSAGGAMTTLAKIYQKIGEGELSTKYLDSAMVFAQKQYDLGLMSHIYEAYVYQYQQQQDYQKAFEYLTQVIQLRDSLKSQMQTRRAAEIDAAYNFDKNLAEINFLQKNNQLQRTVIGVFSAATLMLIVFSFVLDKLIRHRTQANRTLARQKLEIEQRNKALQRQKDRSLRQNSALEKANEQISVLNKKLEQKVRFSEEILRSAYENASEAYFIMRAVKDRKKIKDFVCLDVNRAAEQLLNLTKEELLGERVFSILPFIEMDEYLDTLTKVFEENIDFEQDMYLDEEGKFPVWIQMTVNQIEGGVALKIKDITYRKAQEQKLKTSEANISAMINNTTDLIISIDPDYCLTEFNEPFVKAVEAQHGFIPHRGQSVFDAIHEINLEGARKNFERALQGESMADHYEIPVNEQVLLYAEAFFSPIMLEQQPIGATVVIRDITGRKQDEINLKKALNKIRESEKFLSEIIENLPVGMQIYDAQGYLIRMNEAQMEMLGISDISPGQINALKEPFNKAYGIDNLFAQAYQGNTLLNQEVFIDKGNPSDEWEAVNNKMWISISTIPVHDADGTLLSVIGMFSDITERKEAEVALRESEQRLRTVINNIPVILWTTDKDGIFTMSEGKALEKLALQPGQVVGISIFELYAEYEDQLKVLRNAMEKGMAYESTDRVGKTVFNAKAFPLRNEQDEIIGLIGMSIDITDRVEYEEKLKQQHQEIISTNKKIAEYKLMALRSVMNPHFLFNALNSIQFFIAKHEREHALNYLSLFSKLIRGVLNSSVNSTITLAQELEILKYYVELESLRFENKFEADFVVSEEVDVENVEIPSLLIQPYVENAIMHGLYNNEGSGRLTVSLSRHKDVLQCVVEDNGVGRKEALRIKKQNTIRHKSVGMMVTRERLDIINKTNKVSVKIHDLRDKEGLACGTRVEILIQI